MRRISRQRARNILRPIHSVRTASSKKKAIAVLNEIGKGESESAAGGFSYTDLSYLNRLSKQERKRVEDEILKGYRPGECIKIKQQLLKFSKINS